MKSSSTMALKFLIQFPVFAPPPDQSLHHHHRSATEIHFSRWNNNGNKFARQERTQKEIEDQLRFQKRFNTVDRINTTTTVKPHHIPSPTPSFKSVGTPSAPSRSSILGKKSKYSKPPDFQSAHPAFRRELRPRQIPNDDEQTVTGVKVSDSGVSYVIPEAPFEFQYSYTETPKVKPVRLREPPIAPFGPGTMPRPWTGRKPLAPSKKKLEFDSFKLPPAHKKGVKPVQAPGPYLPGSGPRYARSREEVLGEPLSKEEIDELLESCKKSSRQLNMGRDGFTHNMLDNIHALWKRKRVCKIKCIGVCTVDMENVRQQLEEKTGGKIIRSQGGIIYLFRGRNYNFKTRPVFPLMLWKPASPVYPRLVKRVPDGLTLDEANDMRKKGRELIPICKLGKNGVYCNLVENVREAFEACELVRINCQGLNRSDYHKIGAKLKDLVPCVLISFEYEHILMWRGRDWKSMFPELEDKPREVNESGNNEATAIACLPNLSTEDVIPDNGSNTEDVRKGGGEDISIAVDNSHSFSTTEILDGPSCSRDEASGSLTESLVSTHRTDDGSESVSSVPLADGMSQELSENRGTSNEVMLSPQTEGVLLLLKQAVEGGSAVVLDDSCLDADTVFRKAVALAQRAPPGPTFRHRVKKVRTQEIDKPEAEEEVKKVPTFSEKKISERRSPKIQKKIDLKEDFLTVVPPGTLRVDELAKLLA